MSDPAFFMAHDEWSPHPVLKGTEAKHCNVLRLKPGDSVILLDGAGQTARCRVEEMGKKEVRLSILGTDETPRPKSLAIVALALSKATRRGFFFEKAAELGAYEIWLWQAVHSQGKLSQTLAESCQGQLLAGCKQCHNPWLPKARVMKGIEDVIKESVQAQWRILPWEAQTGVGMLKPDELGRPGISLYVIGPEGGFAENELAAMKEAAFMPASLGGRVLRCETAATLCLGLHWWASQLPGHPDFKGQ